MVVSEDNNPKSTTTSEIKESTDNKLKLDYTLPVEEKIEEEVVIENELEYSTNESDIREEILSETNIIDDEILEEETDNILTEEIALNIEPKMLEIPFEKGIETGLEIFYTSLKLKDFPIREANLPLYEDIVENISLNSCNINIGKTVLSNVNVRILGYNKFKLIEFKTREFKLALSINLFDDNTIRKAGDYFSYEIFSKLKDIRLLAVANILKLIFSGELITFKIKDLYGEIQFENSIQAHKFDMVIESIKKYEECMKLLNLSKWKNFSESSIQFYTLHLLHSYLNNKQTINSWINFKIDNQFNINSGDKISFTKIHELNIRGFNYTLKEKATVKSPISDMEINSEKNIISGYRKVVDIELEIIEKN